VTIRTFVRMSVVSCITSFFAMGVAGGQEKNPRPTIEENVFHRLKQLGLENSINVFDIGKKGDRIYATSVSADGTDRLWDDVHRNKKVWARNSIFWTDIFHGKNIGSWRTAKNDSLHVTAHYLSDGSRFYEFDIDRWAPKGIHTPINSVRHIIVEVLWNRLSGHTTNQARIEHGLEIIDARAEKIHEKPKGSQR